MIHAHTITRPSAWRHDRARSREEKRDIDWAAAGWAGLIAGVMFILLESVFLDSMFIGDPNSDAMRRIAAIALGDSVLPQPTPYTALVFVAAMAVHLPLSLLYARILAALVHGFQAARAAAVGAVFGVSLYAVNYYVFTGIFPWFAAARGWMTLLSHVVFGVVAAVTYILLTERKTGKFPHLP